MVSRDIIRRSIWACGFVAITAMGTWYGAGLKTREQFQAAKKKRLEAAPEQIIAMLEERRAALMTKRAAVERKLEEIEKRKNGATRAESMAGMGRQR